MGTPRSLLPESDVGLTDNDMDSVTPSRRGTDSGQLSAHSEPLQRGRTSAQAARSGDEQSVESGGLRLADDPGFASRQVRRLADSLLATNPALIHRYVDVLVEAWAQERRVVVFGNGGSGMTASHHAADIIKTATGHTRCPLFAISLTDNVALATAVANDVSYAELFSYLIPRYAAHGDVAVAFTASGTSPNIVAGVRTARDLGLEVVAFTGQNSAMLEPCADLIFASDCADVGLVEASHGALAHIATALLHRRVTPQP